MKLFRKIMHFLVYLYYTQSFYRTSTSGQNHAYCIRIFTVYTQQLTERQEKSYKKHADS